MNALKFSTAKAVWVPFVASSDATVSQYGFYHAMDLPQATAEVVIRLTARSMYRLYVNGEIVMHGPARTAHGYCRVDEINITKYLMPTGNHIGVEVIEYGQADGQYSNDCTLERGLFVAEILADGQVISATGRDAWLVCPITARVSHSERISHSRESSEVYVFDGTYATWKKGEAEFLQAVLFDQEPIYLAHNALLPTLQKYPITNLVDFGPCFIDESIELTLRPYHVNAPYYGSLIGHPTEDCRRTVHSDMGCVKAQNAGGALTLTPVDTKDFYAFWDGGENRVGFVSLKITCEKAGIIDIVPTELLETDGEVFYGYYFVIRLYVPAGTTEFVAMEPSIARYMKLICRGVGKVTVQEVSMLDDTYPDLHKASFLCSDDNVNRLYQAAKKTLLLNTLDIFMDCPSRERGGWLCDSLWTARAATLMLSDALVEKEFLENFLLTPAEGMYRGFFPEVYPASKVSFAQSTGITTWSFWLMCEVCEYIRRTGDIAFRDEHKARIAAFVKGSGEYIGKSGLIEHLPSLFVDWSLANEGIYNQPVSTPANALYAYMLMELGETFGEPDWVAMGQEMRCILRSAIIGNGRIAELKHLPDSFNINDDGTLRAKGVYSEASMYTSLWAGLFTPEEAPLLVKTVRDKMGSAPVFAKTPYVGNSGLFIGLCIRLDMLCRQGYMDKMYEDMLAIYEPQLREGPGTLWENEVIDCNSRCHAFNAHAGVHLMRDVLGLGIPTFDTRGEGKRHITIAPHICGLRWAKGTHETPDGLVSVYWKYDGEAFSLQISIPASMTYDLLLPREVKMLDESKVSVCVHTY